jgi:hypothetical protein
MNAKRRVSFDGTIQPDKLYDTGDMCEILCSARSTVAQKIKDGVIPVVYDGRIPKATGRTLIRLIAAMPTSR